MFIGLSHAQYEIERKGGRERVREGWMDGGREGGRGDGGRGREGGRGGI